MRDQGIGNVFLVHMEGGRGNELRYMALEGIRIWLWDLQSWKKGYRGEVSTRNAVME